MTETVRVPASRSTSRATRPAPTLSAEQVATVLELLEGAGSAELKLTVPEVGMRSAVAALGMDPLAAEIRQVCFFDTPDLVLNRGGLVVRARRVQRKPGDSVVKLRPVDPKTLAPELRGNPQFGIEVDAMPGGYVCSGSIKNKVEDARIREVWAGTQPLRKLFTKDQRALYRSVAPAGLGLDDLSLLGPIIVLKLKFTPDDLARRVVAELWTYPDGSRILELSTKCEPGQAFQVAAEARGYLARHGVDLSGVQQTKTKAALTFFAKELAGAPTPR